MTIAHSTYGTTNTFTITLTGLAADSSLAAGRAGTPVDLSAISPPPVDVLIGGFVSISSAYSAGAAGRVEVWASGSMDGAAFGGNLATADGNFTPQNKSNMRPLGFVNISSAISALVSSQSYDFGPFSLGQAFGGALPKYFNLFFVQNLSTSLNSQSSFHNVHYMSVWYASS